MEENKKDPALELAADMCDEFIHRFSAVDKSTDATHRWSTSEIVDAICKHTGIMVSSELVFQTLKDAGFGYEIDDTYTSIRFVWLLRAK